MELQMPYDRWERTRLSARAAIKAAQAKRRGDEYWFEEFSRLSKALMVDTGTLYHREILALQHLGRV